MPRRTALASGSALRAFALRLPEVEEVETWDIPTFRVHRKMIAIMADDEATASIKASVDEQHALVKADPQTYSFAPYVGRHGWVLCQLSTTPLDVLEELLIEAWRATAPKRLVHAWDQRGPLGGN
jgi:hypothetical protein